MNATMDGYIVTTAPTQTTTGGSQKKDSSGLTENEKIIIIVMLSFLSVIGSVGNAMAIYVFSNLKQKLTSTIFILTLAGTDFVTCLITMPFTIAIELLEYVLGVDLICKVYHFLITTTVPFSCVVIVAIAIDRYLCICHPFHHWMTTVRARIIIGALAVVIFATAGVICMHYTIYAKKPLSVNSTAPPEKADFNSTSEGTLGGGGLSYPDNLFTVFPFSPGPSYTQDVSGDPAQNESESEQTPPLLNVTSKPESPAPGVCNIVKDYISESFFSIFRYLHPGIFLVSCVIVLILYSLIYRSVISQRRKKLRIKSAQCCLLWKTSSLENPAEAAEMTQDFELSQVNGDNRGTVRQNSAATGTDDSEPHNNGAVRKCSLSKARIERMRVANIKTAFTLFIVTLVFILAFLPSWLMALQIVQMNVVVFYTHYVYNVVNPFIYAFLNQNFNSELRRIFRCEKR